MRQIILFLFSIFFVFPLIITAQNKTSLEQKIINRLHHQSFKHASVGISVYDLKDRKNVLDINGTRSLIPASTIKLLTTLTALDQLGEEFRFCTKLSYNGTLKDGILNGNLYVEGSGDPTLGSGKLGQLDAKHLINYLVEQIKSACIEEINGQIIADESIFDSFPISPSWQWNDIGNYYATGAWGININENQYEIVFSNRNRIGARPNLVGTNPKIPGLLLSNEIRLDSMGTGDQAYVFGGPYNFKKRLVGKIPIGSGHYSIKGAIPNPPLFLAQVLSAKLEKKGILNNGATTQFRKKREKRTVFKEIYSPSLGSIISKCNFESNNLFCESILKTIAFDKYNEGSGAYGIRTIRENLSNLKLNWRSLHMEDGSGISSRNLLSSNLMSQFIGKYANKLGIDNLKKYLPKAGFQGTVRRFAIHSSAKGKLWVKSGSMNGTLNYAGIIQCKSGKYYSFAIMVNHFDIHPNIMSRKIVKIINDIYLSI